MKFEIGDKVICVEDSRQLALGAVYTIRHCFYSNAAGSYFVTVEESNAYEYCALRFIPATPLTVELY